MLLRKLLIISFFSLAHGQSFINSFGLGDPSDNPHAAQNGLSNIGITPSFEKGVSLNNPSTWVNLNFSYLSLSYISKSFRIKSYGASTNESNIAIGQMIIPVKNKMAFGLSIRPYMNQRTILSDTLSSNHFIAFSDTINIKKKYEGSGGINSFSLAFSYKIVTSLSLGIGFDYLFGSSRHINSLFLSDIPIVQINQYSYEGLNLNLSFAHEHSLGKFYFKTYFPIKSIDINNSKFHPFEDINKNGFHDNVFDYTNPGYDSPSPLNSPLYDDVLFKDVLKTISTSVGLSRDISNRLNLSFEYKSLNNNYNSNYNSLSNGIKTNILNSSESNIGIVWFSNNLTNSFFNKFVLRSGLSNKSYKTTNQSISELGISLGIGFKFKTIGNQIDFSFRTGSRNYLIIKNEVYNNFQIGITLADIWFIKRRQR